MDSSDDESLAGLTQEPSQERINALNFHLKDPQDLIDCSGNQQSDFDNFVGEFCAEKSVVDKLPSEIADKSTDLFPTLQGEDHERDGLIKTSEQNPSISMLDEMDKSAAGPSRPIGNREPYVVHTEDISDDEITAYMEHYEGTQEYADAVGAKRASSEVFDDEDFTLFKRPRTEEEMDNMGKKRISDATGTKIQWALRAYERWREFRRKMYIRRPAMSANRGNRYIHPLKESVKHEMWLTEDICDFIAETKKESGAEYPPGTIYDLVLMISLHLEREFNIKRLCSLAYPRIRNTLNHIMIEQAQKGLGQQKEKDYVTEEQEEVLWQKQLLGDDNPDKLRLTLFFLLGKHFGLRGGSEHRDLIGYPRRQIQFEEVNGKRVLVYREFVSKTNQGGLASRNVRKPRVVFAFPNKNHPERCLQEIYCKYQRRSPMATDNCTAFYLRTSLSWNNGGKLWYTRQPVGRNFLNDYLKNLMAEAGFSGNFTNHSLRATTASRLFVNNCPDQLIAEQTGHTSSAIRRYKKTSVAQKENVSDLLCKTPNESAPQSESSGQKTVECSAEKHDKVATKTVNCPQTVHPIDVHVPSGKCDLSGLVNINVYFK